MTDHIDAFLTALNGKSKVTILAGTFVSATASNMVVDVGGGRIPAQSLTDYLPEINENIWVLFVDGKPFVVGPTATIPDRGTVVSAAGGLVTLTPPFGDNITCPYGGATAPTAGQVWKLTKTGGYFAVALMSNSPAPNVAPAGGFGGAKAHTDYFTAIDAGSYGSGRWWTPNPYGSDNNQGAWFYGSKISDSLPASAVISSVSIWASTIQISGANPNYALHSYMSKPGGAPSFGAQQAAACGGWITLPTAWGNSLKHGGGSYGIGVNHGGYNIFKSLAQDGFSGRLRIASVY